MQFLVLVLDFYSLIVFVAVVLSWLRLSPENPVVRVVTLLTEPPRYPSRGFADSGSIRHVEII